MENLETDDDNKEETVTEEEGLEKDDQNEDSSVIGDQSFHPEEDNIEVYDENQKEEFGTQDINESFFRIQDEPRVNGRTGLEELKIEFNKGKLAPCADTYLRRETAKERNMNWCEENGMKKTRLLNSRNLQLQRPKVLVLL